jgi:putative transposase
MSRPPRPSDPSNATGLPRTFFVTTRTAAGRSLFQTERMANLLIEVLRTYIRERKFTVHDFVVMPNHVHVLMTIPGEVCIERVMQLIKGNFSFRAKRELGFPGEIWQRGFSDVRIVDEQSFRKHQDYTNNNPVRAGLANSPDEFAYGSTFLKKTEARSG